MIKPIKSNFELYQTLVNFSEENKAFLLSDNGKIKYINNIISINPLTEIEKPLDVKKIAIRYNENETLTLEADVHYNAQKTVYENFKKGLDVDNEQESYHSYYLQYEEDELPLLYYFHRNYVSILEVDAVSERTVNQSLMNKIQTYGMEKLLENLDMNEEDFLDQITYGNITFPLVMQLKELLELNEEETTDCFLRRR